MILNSQQYDNPQILIAGCGPAGVSASLFLSREKIPHVIIDKASFPRDKICGDALSGKSVHVLNKIDPQIVKDFTVNHVNYTGCYGIRFVSPGGSLLDVPFSNDVRMLKNAPGFIARRIILDNYLFDKIDRNYADIRINTELTDVNYGEDGIVAHTIQNGIMAANKFRLIIGADGDRSVVFRKLSPAKMNPSSYCAAVRAYYTGVTEMQKDNFIELHFLKELLPGYFWIFPMNDGSANIGIGMLSDVVSKKKINLRRKLDEIIQTHPEFKKRFRNAKAEGVTEGWGLPLGSLRRKLSGNNFLLTGDAGSLIDPFTGEGIGNALYSGMLAAEVAAIAVKQKNYSADFLMQYDMKLYGNLNDELRMSHGIQKLANKAWLFNFIVKKAAKNEMLRETITCMFDDLDIRSRLRKPSFYFKLLFNNRVQKPVS
jgi:geranylgeranyl reductase family protein